jgi:membrane protein DedA with SNARE-associated domain
MTLETIQPLIDWIAKHPDLSGLIVFLFAMGESLAVVGIVVPGVVIMLSVGTLVGLGAINLWTALVFAALGAIAGDWFSYWLGRHFDQQLRHIWPLSRYPKLIPAGEKFFTRHGGKSVLFGRFVGPLRPIIPAVAGIMHMSQAKFYFMNIVSAILWAPVVILPGVAFGNSLQLAQEVFGKLILLVVILIMLSALLGYIAKKLFAYALMTTVNTWGEFFGFDRARENLASFSMAGVLILLVTLFVSQFDFRYQKIVEANQANSTQWWEDNWEIFSPDSIQDKKFVSDYPLAIQWWGSLEDIKTKLVQRQWTPAERLTLNNSLRYFLSEPDHLRLPARKVQLFGSYEKLIMVKPVSDGAQLSILRIWPANKRLLKTEDQLWLGAIYNVNLLSPFDLFHFAVRDENISQSISQFKSDMSIGDDVTVRQKYYTYVGATDVWRGEVLLLSFKRKPETGLPGTQGNELHRHDLDGASLSLLTPGAFQGSIETGYDYDKNGVTVRLHRAAFRDSGGSKFGKVREQVLQQLQHPNNLQLSSIEEKPVDSSGLKGTEIIANYNMLPFGKELVYRVKIIERSPEVWVATAVVKQCDSRGKQVVNTMLNSLEWQASN